MRNQFINIDFTKVEGYGKLTQNQKELFEDTYKIHNSIVGLDYKEDWTPIEVIWVEDRENKGYSYLKVIFKNGDWLHYTQKKEWY